MFAVGVILCQSPKLTFICRKADTREERENKSSLPLPTSSPHSQLVCSDSSPTLVTSRGVACKAERAQITLISRNELWVYTLFGLYLGRAVWQPHYADGHFTANFSLKFDSSY